MPTSDDRQSPSRFNAARYCLAENARLRGDKTALVMVGEGGTVSRLTYAQADRAVRGIAAGDTVLRGAAQGISNGTPVRVSGVGDQATATTGSPPAAPAAPASKQR